MLYKIWKAIFLIWTVNIYIYYESTKIHLLGQCLYSDFKQTSNERPFAPAICVYIYILRKILNL